jgi:hypothetical protein
MMRNNKGEKYQKILNNGSPKSSHEGRFKNRDLESSLGRKTKLSESLVVTKLE